MILADAANGAGMTLDRLSFNGEARSLIGPLKGEGVATLGGELYPFRISAGRYTEENGLKLHINVDPVNRPGIETDGVLALAGGAPRFEGTLSLARPVGIAAPGENSASRTLTQAWRISGKIKASAQSALMENLEFQYGWSKGSSSPVSRILNSAKIRVSIACCRAGKSISTVLWLVATAAGRCRPRRSANWRNWVARFSARRYRSRSVLGSIRSRSAAPAYKICAATSVPIPAADSDRFEFRAPGFTQAKLSGQLAVGAGDVVFTGPADIQTGDPKVLATWLEGRMETGQGELQPTHLRGDLTIGNEQVEVERLKAEFDGKTISGRLAYYFTTPDRKARTRCRTQRPQSRCRCRAWFRQFPAGRIEYRAAARYDHRRRHWARHHRRHHGAQCQRAVENRCRRIAD